MLFRILAVLFFSACLSGPSLAAEVEVNSAAARALRLQVFILGEIHAKTPFVVRVTLENRGAELIVLPWRSLARWPPELRLTTVIGGEERVLRGTASPSATPLRFGVGETETAVLSCLLDDNGLPLAPSDGSYQLSVALTVAEEHQVLGSTRVEVKPEGENDRVARDAAREWLMAGVQDEASEKFPWVFWWKILTARHIDNVGGLKHAGKLIATSRTPELMQSITKSDAWRDLFQLACGKLAYLRLGELGGSGDIETMPIQRIMENEHFKLARKNIDGLAGSSALVFARREALWLAIGLDYIQRDYRRCDERIQDFLKNYAGTEDVSRLESYRREINSRLDK